MSSKSPPPEANTPAAPKSVSFDTPVVRGEQTIDAVSIRKPSAGDLRGLSLLEVTQLDVNALAKLLPRITAPALTEHDVYRMDVADLLACGAEIAGFLGQKRSTAASLEA